VADDRLPPRTLTLHLPAMTAAQAEQLLDVVDTLAKLLWEEYGDAVLDRAVLREPPDPDPSDEELPPF
jgi:hypothetical protein